MDNSAGPLNTLCVSDQFTTSVTVVLCTSGLEFPVIVIVYVPRCVPWAVFMLNAELTEPLPGVRLEGENEQLDCVGRPEQDSETL